MKSRFIFTTSIIFFFSFGLLRAQVVNQAFGSVKGWTGTCTVVIVDSTAESRTEYVFEGPALLRNEIDMSPYNTYWPNPSLSFDGVDAQNLEEMMKASKALEDKWKIWNARIRVNKQAKYRDEVSSADYTCTFNKTEMLKLQITITGNTVLIIPDINLTCNLDCKGTEDDAAVSPQKDDHLFLSNFQITSASPTDGSKRLAGEKTIVNDTRRISAQWDFSPVD